MHLISFVIQLLTAMMIPSTPDDVGIAEVSIARILLDYHSTTAKSAYSCCCGG